MQNLDVPVPPVTNDFTDIVYTTSDGACDYKIGRVRPSNKKDGAYKLDLNYSTVGDSLSKSMTMSSVSYSSAELKVTSVSKPADKVVETGKYIEAPVSTTPDFKVKKDASVNAETDLTNYLVKTEDGKYVSRA